MKKTGKKKLLLLVIFILGILKSNAQCVDFEAPEFFFDSQDYIYCKDQFVQFGIANPVISQHYTFIAPNAVANDYTGPLDGNGGQLSVKAIMQSAKNAGSYMVRSYNDCGMGSDWQWFNAYYGGIDNLSIESWGNNSVRFTWAPCGYADTTIYDYAVTTEQDPNATSINYHISHDTTATVSGLINGTTYYIHVKLNRVVLWKDDHAVVVPVYQGCNLSFSTIRFVACSGAAPVGTLSPVNSIACVNSSVTLSATGGNSYAWYKDDNIVPITGANSSTYDTTGPGQYRVYMTTAAGCEGMVKTATVTQATVDTGKLCGGGSYLLGDTIRIGISQTRVGQIYELLKYGIPIDTLNGIGYALQSQDTIWFNYSPVGAPIGDTEHLSVRTSNAYCSPVEFGDVTTIVVTGTTSGWGLCPLQSTSLGMSPAGSGYNYQWQVDNGHGFINIENDDTYSGATTDTLAITSPSTDLYGSIFRCIATGPSTITSELYELSFTAAWMGTSNSSWNNSDNWSCGVVPDKNTDVLIPPDVPNNPEIKNGTFYCRTLFAMPGSTTLVKQPNGKLIVTKHLYIQ